MDEVSTEKRASRLSGGLSNRMTIFKAYCWNSNTGRDFTIKKPNWNIVQRCSLKSIETIELLPQHIYLFRRNDRSRKQASVGKRKQCPDDWNRPFSYGSVVTKPQGENKNKRYLLFVQIMKENNILAYTLTL